MRPPRIPKTLDDRLAKLRAEERRLERQRRRASGEGIQLVEDHLAEVQRAIARWEAKE